MAQKIKNIRSAASIKDALQANYGIEIKAEVHHVEHHLAHFWFLDLARRRVFRLTALAISPAPRLE
jgi:hypothetical protein